MNDIKSFNPEKLIEAREFRKITKNELSKKIDVSVQSLVAYEKGKAIPSFDSMKKLVEALRFPYQFFFQNSVSDNVSKVFFRSYASATKSERKSQIYRITWLTSVLSFIEKYFELNNANIPSDFYSNLSFKEIKEEQIEYYANKLRIYWKIGLQPVTNMINLLESNSIIVAKGNSESSKIDAFSKVDPLTKNPLVFLSSYKNNYYRTRFDAAHELGHIILHSNLRKEELTNENLTYLEDQANYFAGAFLMPAETFSRNFFYPSLDEFLRLKKFSGMSVAALIMRASNLNFISEETKTKLFMNYSKRKWRTNGEPLDNTILPEEPKFLSLCINALLEKKILKVGDIIEQLNLPLDEIANLINFDFANYKEKENPYFIEIKIKKNENQKRNLQIFELTKKKEN
ncbi:MAG: ImmA/IrrE family metallo-endopeptidase [Ignavibacteriae bacterium]|nr:ImmA/IrrE family metallo-endopeptidase [Ignavibacteriota bacterium]